jgi:hypothetical protein
MLRAMDDRWPFLWRAVRCAVVSGGWSVGVAWMRADI